MKTKVDPYMDEFDVDFKVSISSKPEIRGLECVEAQLGAEGFYRFNGRCTLADLLPSLLAGKAQLLSMAYGDVAPLAPLLHLGVPKTRDPEVWFVSKTQALVKTKQGHYDFTNRSYYGG